MKPLIGVTPDFNAGDREDMGGREPTYFLRARYIQAIERLGGLPFILPLLEDRNRQRLVLSNLDGLLLTGSGPDLPPELYGEKQRFRFRKMSPIRSGLELGLAKLAYDAKVPMLGICGGMQAMNVALGGTLFQDIPSQIKTTISHQPPDSATKHVHSVVIAPRSLLRRITGRSTIRVNSSHHQSVKRVAPPLIQTAVASDGVVEAIEAPSHKFLLGIQWHPEFLYDRDPTQERLFRSLVNAAKTYALARRKLQRPNSS